MGYRIVGVEARDKSLLKPFVDAGLEALTRLTIRARAASEAAEAVRSARRYYDVIAVEPEGVEAARFAARDGRVDVVSLKPGMARYMDRSQARLIAQGGGVIEVPLNPTIERGERGLRALMIVARRAVAFDAPFTVSSCARTMWEMWPPYSLAGLLIALGVPEHHALLAVTAYPASAIRRWMEEV
jgi:ribonuclease P/MRP protein subunit RPP1